MTVSEDCEPRNSSVLASFEIVLAEHRNPSVHRPFRFAICSFRYLTVAEPVALLSFFCGRDCHAALHESGDVSGRVNAEYDVDLLGGVAIRVLFDRQPRDLAEHKTQRLLVVTSLDVRRLGHCRLEPGFGEDTEFVGRGRDALCSDPVGYRSIRTRSGRQIIAIDSNYPCVDLLQQPKSGRVDSA